MIRSLSLPRSIDVLSLAVFSLTTSVYIVGMIFENFILGYAGLLIGTILCFMINYSKEKTLGFTSGFFLGSVFFIILPGMYYYIVSRFGFSIPLIPNSGFSSSDIVRAMHIVAIGLLSYMLGSSVVFKTMYSEFVPRKLSFALYFISLLCIVVLLNLATIYGTREILLSAFSGIILALSSLSASVIYRKSPKFYKLLYFLPPLYLAFASTNRGTLLLIMIIIFFSVIPGKVKLRYFLPVLVLGYLGAALLAGFLFERRLQERGITVEENRIVSLTQESIMVPTLGIALRGLEKGQIEMQYGRDLLLTPLYFIPRVIWPQKPDPLDFRLNRELNLNSGEVFGTPVSIFGGAFLNTGILFPLFMFFLGYLGAALNGQRDKIVSALLFVYAIDLVRVGDISRETVTFGIFLTVFLLLHRRRS